MRSVRNRSRPAEYRASPSFDSPPFRLKLSQGLVSSSHPDMDGIGIYDQHNGSLSVDLIGLLRALGPAASSAWWRARTRVWYIAAEGVILPALEEHESGGRWMSGSDLIAVGERLHQVVDGVIEGVGGAAAPQENDAEPWVVLRAVDSSWWEVYADDSQVLRTLRDCFRDVRPALYTADHLATEY
jgi:hypothetical protein